MSQLPPGDEHDSFELQPLEARVLLSGEGWIGATAACDQLLDTLRASDLFQSAIVETEAAEATPVTTNSGTNESSDDLFADAASIAVAADQTEQPTGAPVTSSIALESDDTATTVETAATTGPARTLETPSAIVPTADAPNLSSPHLTVTTLPNGPPATAASTTTPQNTSASAPNTAAATLPLAASFTSALSAFQTQLPQWAAFFDLGSVNFSAQGLSSLSLPVLPDSLSSLFGLGSKVGAVSLPSFSTAETKDAFVNQLSSHNFTITSIDGGFSAGGINIPASSGTTLLEGSLTLTIGTGFSAAPGFSGNSYNSSTPSVLSGLASNLSLNGAISWTGDLSLTFNFALDSSAGFLLRGDSAFTLTITGTGNLAGTADAGGNSGTHLSGTAHASLTVALGFRDPSAHYALSQLGATTVTPTATGIAGLTLNLTTGPVTLSFGASYTLTANLAARSVTQSIALTLTGSLQLPGFKQPDGSAGAVTLTGAFNSGTQTWTITGSSTSLLIFNQKLTSLSVATTFAPTAFSGSFIGTLELDFLKNGSAPATVSLNATYDHATVTINGTATIAALAIGGTAGNTLLSATDATLSASLTGNIAAGTLTGSLALKATSAAFQPNATSFTSAITDGPDADSDAFAGSYDFAAEAFALVVDQFALTAANAFRASAAGVTLNYDRKSTDAAQVLASVTTASVELTALASAGGSAPPTFTLSKLVVRQNGFAFDNFTSTFADVTLGGGILKLTTPGFTLNNVNYTTGAAPVGTLGLTTATAELFPSAASNATLTTVAGTFDFATLAFSLSIQHLAAKVGSVLTFTGSGLTFGYQPTGPPSQTVLSADTLTAAFPSGSLSATLTGLAITADGAFRGKTLTVDTSGLANTIGLGELLPFQIDTLQAKFTGVPDAAGRSDLSSFDLTVRGSIDFSKLSTLPFTPIVQIGPAGSTQTYSKDSAQPFEFTVAVSGSSVKPKDLGPITLGFSDLKIGGTVTLGGTLTLGGYADGVFQPNFAGTFTLQKTGAVSSINGNATATLAGTYDTTTRTLATNGTLNVSFTYGDKVDVENAQLAFTLTLSADATYKLTHANLALTSGSVGSVTLNFGSLLQLRATSATFDFTATGKAPVATFGSLTATFPDLAALTGTATNFGFAADGSLLTFDGFGVSINAQAGDIKWPSWLPIQIQKLELKWANFAADALDFKIVLSASAQSLNGVPGLTVAGSITNVIIDIGLLKAGHFPIVGLDSLALQIQGDAFGGTLGGTLILGLIRVDATGKEIAGADLTTPVARRVLYGAIQAKFDFGGMSGFEIRIGVSELGPLQVYLAIEQAQILEPISGLAITNFHAGVSFNNTLPSITDPLLLRTGDFKSQDGLTLLEWQTRLTGQVLNQLANNTSFWSAFSAPMRIEGGATLFSVYAGEGSFKADTDIIFDTTGRVFINVRGTFGGTVSLNFRLYADLTQIKTTGTFLFLADLPNNPAIPPVLTLRGGINFKFLQADGTPATATSQASTFYLSIAGGADATLASVGSITLDATLTLRFTSDRFTADFNGTLKFGPLGNAIAAVGQLTVLKNGDTYDVWGAATLTVKFDELEKQGAFAAGTAVFRLNTTAAAKTVALTLPGQTTATNIDLPAQSFSVAVTGTLSFKRAGQDWFAFNGTFAFTLSPAGADVALKADLEFGGTGANATLTLTVDGYMALRVDGFAMKLDATLKKDFAASAKMSLSGTFRIALNTTGRDVSYQLPPGITIDGSSTVSLSGRADTATAAGSYLVINAAGTLIVDGKFSFAGTFALTVAPALTRIAASATVDLSAGSKRLFRFAASGFLDIEPAGTAGYFTLTVTNDGNLPADAGFTATLSMRFEFNSRNTAFVTTDAARLTLAANTTQFYGVGQLSVEGVVFDGHFTFQRAGDMLAIGGAFDTKVADGGKAWLTLTGSGGFAITSGGLAADMQLALKTGPAASDRWSISGTFRLQINTSSVSVTLPGATSAIPASITAVSVTNAVLTIGDFALNGNFTFTHLPGRFYITGDFTLSLDAAGKHLFTLSGSVSITLYNTGIIGRFALGIHAGSSATPQGETWSLDATFELQLNTLNQAVTIAGKDVPANFIQLGATGKIVLRDSFTLEGSFTFTKQASTITINADVAVKFFIDGQIFFTLYGKGGLQVSSAGTTAFFALTSDSSDGRTAGGTGWLLKADFSFRMNTTSAAVTLAGTSIKPGIAVHAAGTLSLDDFTLNGIFDFTYNAAGDYIMDASFGFTLQTSGVQLFSFTGAGEIKVKRDGIVLWINLNLTSNLVDAKHGWSFSGAVGLTFQVNSRSVADSAAGFALNAKTSSVSIGGTFKFGSSFYANGNAIFQRQGDSFTMSFAATFYISPGGTHVLTLDSKGSFAIDATGTAGQLTLSFATDAAKTSTHGWTLDATLHFEFNTRSAAAAGVAANTIRVVASGSLTYRSLALQGTFDFTDSAGTITLAADVTLDVMRDGVKIVGVAGKGSLTLGSDGLYGYLHVSLTSNVPTAHGWSFDSRVNVFFEINTTHADRTVGGRNLPATASRVWFDGDLSLSGFDLRGSFSVTWISDRELVIGVNAHLVAFRMNVAVAVNVAVFSDGVVITTRLDLPQIDYQGVQISGKLELFINTTGRDQPGVRARSAYVAVDHAEIQLHGISLSGSIQLSSAGVITVPAQDPLQITVAGQRAAVSGTLDIEQRKFNLTGSLAINLGHTNVAAISGTGAITISDNEARIEVHARLWAFNWDIGRVDSSLYLTPDGFAFDVGYGFTAGIVGFGGNGSFYTRKDGSIYVSFSGKLYLYGFSADAHGFCDTRNGTWAAKGHIGGRIGDDNFGASLDITVCVGNTTYEDCAPGVWFSVHAWAQWHGIGISASLDGTINADYIALRVDVKITHVTIYVNLNNGSVHLSQIAGATVFLDVNHNGLLDPGEPVTTTDQQGSFTFTPAAPIPSSATVSSPLGGLATYDRNGNGVIDAAEGRLLLIGGTHFIDDLPAATPVELAANAQGFTRYRGATVFFDANRNGVRDADELAVVTSATGAYSFIGVGPSRTTAGTLGSLAAFDTNRDGIITPDEGQLVATGGTYLIGGAGPVGSAATTTIVIGEQVTGTNRIARAGATVFLDLNGNRQLDVGEPSALTDRGGTYTFVAATTDVRIANLGALARYDTNQNGLLEPAEGQLRTTGGTRLDEAPDTPLVGDRVTGYLAFAGATVWFDANNNNRIDAGEVATTTTAAGFYNFLAGGTPVRDGVTGAPVDVNGSSLTRSLGGLAPFDTNRNGIIDDSEGVFVITGGTDVHTGQPNTRTLTVPADTYGSLSGTTASPLSELYQRLRELGLDSAAANARLQTAFALPTTTDVRFLSPRPEAATNSGLADDIETTAKHISFFVRTGAEMLIALSDGRGLTYAQAEDAIETELARRIAGLAPATPFAPPGAPALALDSAELIKSTFIQAATALALPIPFNDRLDAAAAALAGIETRVGQMRAAELAEITEALARLQAALHDQFFPAVRELFAARLPVADFTARFNADSLRELVRNTGLAAPNDPPTVSLVESQTRRDDPAGVSVAFTARDPDGLASDLNVTVASSNPALIRTDQVTVVRHGDTFTLQLARVPARTGTATITVGIQDGANGTTITRSFDVTVLYTYADLINDLLRRDREAAAQDEAARQAERLALPAPAIHATLDALLSDLTSHLVRDLATTFEPTPLAAATSLAALETPRALRRL